MASFSFRIEPAPPFRLDLTVWVLRRRPENLIDRWDGETYRRVLFVRDTLLDIAVSSIGSLSAPMLEVVVQGSRASSRLESEVKSTLTAMLGVQVNLSGFYRIAEKDKMLKPLARRFRGIKPPLLPTLFEALINGIACQQLSLTIGILLLNRLSSAYGKVAHSGNYAFPRPSEVQAMRPEDLRGLGFSYAKARAAVELARAVASGEIDLEALRALDDDTVRENLLRLKGVGRWTAEYAMLRGLGRLSIFPGEDVGARNRLEKLYLSTTKMTFEKIDRILSRWTPYAGLVYFHLLLAGLEEKGLIKG
jgi:DNA-3-methyladenine glycosylase II